jgi:hypothetical protein
MAKSHLGVCGTVALLAGMLLSAPASGTTITFSGLSGANEAPFTTYTESGFTVTPLTGTWFQGQIFGNPVPSIFSGPLFGSPATDSIEITDGSSFTFNQFDMAANNGNVTYTLTGMKGGLTQYTLTSTELANTAVFQTILNADSGIAIDALIISVTIAGTSTNLDNLVFTPTTVPLPAALPLFATGLGALGLLSWRRKRKVAAAT